MDRIEIHDSQPTESRWHNMMMKQVKCKVDCGAMANIMPLGIFKMLNPSEFDKDSNPISGFNRNMTRLSDFRYHILDVEDYV